MSTSTLPAGYPSDLVRDVELLDGRHVALRPVLPEDEAELRRKAAAADPETLRRRFLGGRGPQTDQEFRRLVVVDYVDRFAVVAVDDDGEGVGIARYERLADDEGRVAEIAVVVDPAWRQIGLATALVHLLGEAALRNGVRRFSAEYFADNIDVGDLLVESGLPYVRNRDPGGVVSVDLQLPEG